MHAQPASPKKPCRVTHSGRHQAMTWHGKVMCWICGARKVEMGSREDDEYWDTKYAEASCYYHGSFSMYFDSTPGEWYCGDCDEEDELTEVYKNG